MKKRYFLIIFVLLFAASMWGLVETVENSAPSANTSSAGIATEQVPVQKDDLISIDTPTTGQTITSPLTVSGKARGNWFFEGSFPVELTTDDGSIIASGVAKTSSDWMTTDYIPFTATLTFPSSVGGGSNPSNSSGQATGYVVLKKDNPSGDPQFDNSVSIKVQW